MNEEKCCIDLLTFTGVIDGRFSPLSKALYLQVMGRYTTSIEPSLVYGAKIIDHLVK